MGQKQTWCGQKDQQYLCPDVVVDPDGGDLDSEHLESDPSSVGALVQDKGTEGSVGPWVSFGGLSRQECHCSWQTLHRLTGPVGGSSQEHFSSAPDFPQADQSKT